MPENVFAPAASGNTPDTAHAVDESATPVGAADPRPVAEPQPVSTDPDAFTHYVWLADGRILKAALPGHTDELGSRYYEHTGPDETETSTPIVGVYAR